jgi:COP9 signalosome complex subunit 2
MSDDDDFMQDSDPEQWVEVSPLPRAKNTTELARYDFEYEDDDEQETGDVGIENKYYNAKQMKGDNPEEAIEEFWAIPAMEQEKGDW